MRSNLAFVALFVSVFVVASLGFLASDLSATPTGNAIGAIRSPAKSLPKYCYSWDQNVRSCFMVKGAMNPYVCRSYYWKPANPKFVICCNNDFNCENTGMFVMPSFCNMKTHTCELQ